MLNFSKRRGRAILVTAMLGVFACSEATTPGTQPVLPSGLEGATPPSSGSTLGQIGADLPDATDWVLVAINDENTREKMRATLRYLAGDIVSGHFDSAKQNVAALRKMLAEFDTEQVRELGPIGVALDQIDSEFGRMEQ